MVDWYVTAGDGSRAVLFLGTMTSIIHAFQEMQKSQMMDVIVPNLDHLAPTQQNWSNGGPYLKLLRKFSLNLFDFLWV